MTTINNLFGQPLSVVNVGLGSLARSVREQGVPVIDVDWQPPVEGVPRLRVTKNGIDIDTANEEAIKRIKAARPTLVGMGIARDVIPGMHHKMILHSGPPITWERMCGPQRGAVMGALIYEGIAPDEVEAEKIAASGGDRIFAVPSSSRRRADGRHRLAVDAGVHLREQDFRQSRVLHTERRAWAKCCAMAAWDPR